MQSIPTIEYVMNWDFGLARHFWRIYDRQKSNGLYVTSTVPAKTVGLQLINSDYRDYRAINSDNSDYRVL